MMLEDGRNSNFSGNNPILKPLWPKGGGGGGVHTFPQEQKSADIGTSS